MDGASWEVLSPLLSQRRLPNLEKLYRAGSAGLMRSIEPTDPAALWTSMATGKSRGAHGIDRVIEKVPGRYAVRPVSADRRRVPALWTIAAANGITSGVAGWPVTFPAERIGGFLVVPGYEPGSPAERGFIHPEGAFGREADAQPGLVLSERAAKTAALDPALAEAMQDDLAILGWSLSLYRVYQPRVLLLRFRSVDLASHAHWPRDAAEGSADSSPAIGGAYEFLDEWMGHLLEALPEQTALLIVSDHGFSGIAPGQGRHLDMDRLLEKMGYLRRDPTGRPDWKETRAFGMDDGIGTRRWVYLNVQGEEEAGVVEPGTSESLRTELAAGLRSLTTAQGERLFTNLSVQKGPGPGAPDLEATENPKVTADGAIVLSGGKRVSLEDLYRPASGSAGAHDTRGILLAVGAGIAQGRREWQSDLYDVAPTLLYLLHLPLASDMPGRPIEAILGARVPSDYPQIQTYNALPAAPPPLFRPEAIIEKELAELKRAGHLIEPE